MRVNDLYRNMTYLGADLVICIGNNSGAHIGSCVISEPYEKDGGVHVTSSVRNLLSHKEGEIALLYSEAAAKVLNQTVCCLCGIHYDDITGDELRAVHKWCANDVEEMIKQLHK
ncbi:MAG: hypothetical protein ACRDBO_14140 [Lachnospiraceae bacterium]